MYANVQTRRVSQFIIISGYGIHFITSKIFTVAHLYLPLFFLCEHITDRKEMGDTD